MDGMSLNQEFCDDPNCGNRDSAGLHWAMGHPMNKGHRMTKNQPMTPELRAWSIINEWRSIKPRGWKEQAKDIAKQIELACAEARAEVESKSYKELQRIEKTTYEKGFADC